MESRDTFSGEIEDRTRINPSIFPYSNSFTIPNLPYCSISNKWKSFHQSLPANWTVVAQFIRGPVPVHGRLFPRYLGFITLPHNIELWIILYKLLAARDLLNQLIFLMPQPPRSFGIAMRGHLTSGILPTSFFPAHKKWKQTLRIFDRITFGILVMVAQ